MEAAFVCILVLAFLVASIRGLANMGAFQGLLMFIILVALYVVAWPLALIVNVILFFMGLSSPPKRAVA